MKLDLLIVKIVELNGYCDNDALCIEGGNFIISSLLWLVIIGITLLCGAALERNQNRN